MVGRVFEDPGCLNMEVLPPGCGVSGRDAGAGGHAAPWARVWEVKTGSGCLLPPHWTARMGTQQLRLPASLCQLLAGCTEAASHRCFSVSF